MSYRLTSRQRIRHRRDFKTLFDTGKKRKGSLLSIWAMRQLLEGQKKPAIAIMVSRKVSTKAVTRNLWKRRIREAFRKIQNELVPETAVLIQAQRIAKVPPADEILKELQQLLKKSDLYL
jgi:ribonuclease P protein component